MNRTSRRIGSAAALAVLALVLGPLDRGPSTTAQIAFASDQGPGSAFSVAGSVQGLYPGISTHLDLRITNRMAFAIQIDTIAISVGAAGSNCPASALSVTNFSGSRIVAGHASAVQPVPISMSHAASDACQGAVFPLTYLATATRAGN
jgi:hypothetical protein